MKSLIALLLLVVCCPALAQPGQGRQNGESGRHAQREFRGQMPPPERRMSWEERQRLREQVHSGNMSRDEARERWREQREQRGMEPGRRWEERQKLRRDVQDANRDLQRRR